MNFEKLFLTNILYFYCVYGMASCVSMVVRREDGPLLAVVVSLIIGTLCGYGLSLLRVKQWHLE